jgi:HK97 family phage major capsid protein
MSLLNALRERKQEIARLANKLLADKGDQVWSAEDQKTYDNYMDDLARVNAQINAHQAQLDADAEGQFRQAPGKKTDTFDGVQALALLLRNGQQNLTAEQAAQIRNAMSTTTPAEGGYTVPAEVAKMVIDQLKAYGGMREAAEILSTDAGNSLNFPTSDGTAEEGEIVGENAPATAGDITFGTVALNPFKYSSKKIALPVELVQDSGIDIVGFVIARLSTRLARITNKHFTIGTGSGQPNGIMPASSIGVTGPTGNTVAVPYDSLIDLQHSVNRAYRRNASFMMADSSVAIVRKMKDGQNRPIFVPGYETGVPGGAPDTLLGSLIIVNDDVAAMAANARSIAFGDLSKYIIRDVRGSMSVRRFDDSAFALNGQVGFCGWMRTGGNLTDTAAVRVYRNSAT